MHEAALLAAIRADPDDDVPRMIYADMLLSKNPRDRRGLLIHDQLAVARGDAPPAIANRANQLLEEHQPAWDAKLVRDLGELWNPEVARDLEFTYERGFPYAMRATEPAMLRHRELIDTQPITKLVLRDTRWLPALAGVPALEKIRTLVFETRPGGPPSLGPRGFDQVCQSPHLTALRDLEICADGLDEYDALALAEARWLPQLERLALAGNRLTEDHLRILLAPANVARLTTLELGHVDLFEGGAAALIDSHAPLRRLGLAGALRDPIIAEAVLGAPLLERVEDLDLTGSSVGELGARALAGRARSLRTLVCNRTELTTAGALAIVRAEPPLERLDLRGNALGPEVVTALVEMNLPALHTLHLSDNRIGIAGLDALLAGRGLPALRELSILHNQLMSGAIGWPPRDDDDPNDPAMWLDDEPGPIEFTRDELREKFAKRRDLQLI